MGSPFVRRYQTVGHAGESVVFPQAEPCLESTNHHEPDVACARQGKLREGSRRSLSRSSILAIRLWPWLAAQEGIQRGATSLGSYAGLIRKVAFPHELVVYASVAATLALHLTGYVAVLVVLALAGQPVHFEGLLVALPVLAVLAIAVTGVTLCFAALQVFIRDVEHVLMPLLMILMYLTPILYPLTAVPEAVRPYVAANPFGYLVDRLRAALLDGRLAFELGDLAALLVAAALFFGGRWVFRRLSPTFEDFL